MYAMAIRRTPDTTPPPQERRDECSSCSEYDAGRCAQECMMEAAVREIEYYDDEELDRFAGRPSDGYSDQEVEEFRYVLYTMRPTEAAGWAMSLQLRGVSVPDQLKDELIMMTEDGHT